MKTYHTLVLSALAGFTVLAGIPARAADNMASIAITPATGVVTLTPRWAIGSNLAGFHLMAQDWGLTGGAANQFYSIKNTAIPAGGDTLAYSFYVAGSGAATPHSDIGSKLTPDTYSALTSADPDIGFGSVNQYLIHHKGTTDYLTVIKPGAATASSVTDLKPMSGPGGPSTVTGVSGYFGMTFAAANLGYGLNLFYYLRTDPVTSFTKFGSLVPALAGTATDQFDLGLGGHKALAFTGTDVGYGTNKMYYLRLDPITGFTILGMLDPALAGVRHASDIANLGSVYSTLTFVVGDVGFGAGQFYTTGTVNPTWQSVSFAAIADRALTAGSFTVNPTASSTLPIVLTLVTGSATISAPVAGVFTVTPTAPGLITLQASQAGQLNLFEANMLRQSFTATGGVPDFNGDFKADIVWQNTTSGDRYLWLMNGTAFSSSVFLGNIGTAWQIAGTGDFNNDGKADLVWQNTSSGDRYLWLMNGSTLGTSVYLGNIGTEWKIASTGDLNGDGQTDILWQNTASGATYVWLMNGSTFSSSVALAVTTTAWQIAGTGDFDGDNKTDILWQNTTTGQRSFWFMNGTAFSSGMNLATIGTDWQIVGVADFNIDGSPDILWKNAVTGDIFIWLMNDTNFGSSVYLGNVGNVWAIAN